MAKKRAFSREDIKVKAEDYHGSCQYVRTSPDIAARDIKSVNVDLSFDQALRLANAIQSAVLALNRYDRSKKEGREMGLCLSLKTDSKQIAVIETAVRQPKTRK